MDDIITIIISVVIGGILAFLGYRKIKGNQGLPPIKKKRDYDKIKEEEIEKLKEKPVDDIIAELPDDAADGVGRVKEESDTDFDEAFNRRRNNHK